MKREKNFRLGRRLDHQSPFELPEEMLDLHCVVTGATGYGKSRFLNNLIRAHIERGLGIAVLEPGDLCADIMAYYAKMVVQTGSKEILKRIHYLRASPEKCFRYDMFKMQMFRQVHPENLESFRNAMIHTKVQSVAEVFQAKQGSESFEGMPRLHRILTDILTAIAILVDGKRLSAADADILLDLSHDLHPAVYQKLLPKLPRYIVADFEVLHQFHRIEELRRETESTLNRLRTFFGPLTKAILTGTEGLSCVDLFKIIQNGECLLLPLQEDPFFSHDQKISLGALILHDLIEMLIIMPRQLRKKFTIVIDEAGELICVSGERLMRALGMLRKHGGRMVLAGQNLGTFRKSKDLDLVPKILSQCGTLVTFNQKWPEDTDLLGRVVFAGNFCFDQLKQEVERHKTVWHEVTEHSEQLNVQNSESETNSTQQSTTNTTQESHQTGRTTSDGRTESQQQSRGQVDTRSRPIQSTSRPKQQSHADSASQAQGNAVTHSDGTTETTGITHGRSTMQGTSKGKTAGASIGAGITMSHKKVPLSEISRESVNTGMLEKSFQDQLEAFRQKLACLPKRHAMVRTPNETKAFEIVAEEVPDPFTSSEALMKAIEWVKKELYAIHDYYFTPDLSPEEAERRLREFLGEQDAQPDVIIENGEVFERQNDPDENAYGI